MSSGSLRRATEAATFVLVVVMILLVLLTLFVMSPIAWECVA